MKSEKKRYAFQVTSQAFVLVGAFLVLEHLGVWGGSDMTFGHEWLGLILFVVGFIISLFTRKDASKSQGHK